MILLTDKSSNIMHLIATSLMLNTKNKKQKQKKPGTTTTYPARQTHPG